MTSATELIKSKRQIRYLPKKERAAILQSLGVASNARWEEVKPKIKEKLVRARKAGKEKLSAYYSELQSYLRRTLTRTCSKCGVAISRRRALKYSASHCKLCCPQNGRVARSGPELIKGILSDSECPKTREMHHAYNAQNGATAATWAFIRQHSRPYFFVQEVKHWVHLSFPELSRDSIRWGTRSCLAYLRQKGVITGGRAKDWYRFEMSEELLKRKNEN